MTSGTEWQGRVGRSWADSWQATDRTFAPVTGRLLDLAFSSGFHSALDVGCGAGELSCQLRAAVQTARVTGVDISPELIAVARSRCPEVSFELADAACFVPAAPAPDLVISRHGVMFFADPQAAFGHLRAVSAPGARLFFSCFRARADNGWVRDLTELVGTPLQTDRLSSPGPFAFADEQEVGAMLAASDWTDITFEKLDYPMVAGVGGDAVGEASAYFQRIGPAAAAIAALEPAAAERARDRLEAFLASKLVCDASGSQQVELSASAWIVGARA